MNVVTSERQPQEPEDDEVGDGEEPLHQPQPAAERLVEAGVEARPASGVDVTATGPIPGAGTAGRPSARFCPLVAWPR